MKNLICLLFPFLVFICGCATPIQYVSGIEYSSSGNCPADKACIYVFRPAAFFGSVVHFVISDNDKAIGMTGPNSYLAWQRDPGSVLLESRGENTETLTFTAEAGKSYYILQMMEPGFGSAENSIRFISKDEANRYLKSCHPTAKTVKSY